MKISLNQDVVGRLEFSQKPVEEINGKITKWEANDTAYLVSDSNPKSLVGFCVKVGKTKKTYILQRRHGAKVFQIQIGKTSDFTLEDARKKAGEYAGELAETGKNPKEVEREIETAELTVGECFRRYREYLVNQPCKPTTLLTLDKCLKKLIKWKEIKIKDLTSKSILDRFDEIAAKTPTSAEQTFTWAGSSINYCLKHEQFEAKKAGRTPSLTINPLEILKIENKFRSKKELEAAYEAKGIRKPLSAKDTLGPFLNACWSKRPDNRTGVDFILCSLLWGTRKMEASSLRWRDSLTDKEAEKASYVDLKEEIIFFFDTKNGTNLKLPISKAVMTILKERNEMRVDAITDNGRKWVFPARSKFSKTGSYSDGNSLLKYICEIAQITKRASHDFRRTFGGVAEGLTSYKMVKRLLNHHDHNDMTSRYTAKEWSDTIEAQQKIELHILATAPVVYNALLTPTYPPLPIIAGNPEKNN